MPDRVRANARVTSKVTPPRSTARSSLIRKALAAATTTVVVAMGLTGLPATIASAQAPACVDTTAMGLRAWWALDATVGPTAFDFAGVPNDGTDLGGPTPTAGKVAGALGFDGANDHVSVPSDAELLFGTGSLTIDAWVRTTSKGIQPIVDKRVQNKKKKAAGYALFLQKGRLALQLANGTKVPNGFVNYIDTTTLVANGSWKHVAATVQRGSSPSIVLYVDGVPVKTVTGASVLTGSLNETGPLWIGRRRPVPSAPYANTYFKGKIDEVELANRALTASEVDSLYRAGRSGKCKPLVNLIPVTSVDTGINAGDKTCQGQPYFRYVGGKPDSFASPADTSYPGANLAARIAGIQVARNDYDMSTSNRQFGETFNLEDQRRVCYAVVEVTVQDNASQANNDRLNFGHVDGAGTFSPLAGQAAHPGATQSSPVTRVWAFNQTGLAALSQITASSSPNDSVLDIYMEDDTTIDHIMLWVWYHP